MTERLTIYCSTNDVALFTSLFKNRTKRLGAYGPGLEGSVNHDPVMIDKIRKNVHVVNCDDWCVFDAVPSHSHSHFSDCPWMMADVACVLRGDAQNDIRSRSPVGERWYKLRYDPAPGTPTAQVLRRMAWSWKWIGSIAVNEPMICLVKLKKWFEIGFRLGHGLVSLLAIGITTGIMAFLTHHPLWLLLGVVCVGALIVYVPTWRRGRVVQKREDEAPVPGLPANEPTIRKVTESAIAVWKLSGSGRPNEAQIREAVRAELIARNQTPYERQLHQVVDECVKAVPVPSFQQELEEGFRKGPGTDVTVHPPIKLRPKTPPPA